MNPRIASLVLSLVLSALAATAWAFGPGNSLPNGPPPNFARARQAGGKVHVQSVHFKPVYETRTKDVVAADGTPQTVAYTVCRHVPEMRMQVVDPADVRVITVAGQKLDDAQVGALLAKDADVLLVTNGKKVDPAYAGLLAPNLHVVYLRPSLQEPGCYAAPGAVVPAAPIAAPQSVGEVEKPVPAPVAAPIEVAPAPVPGEAPPAAPASPFESEWKISGVAPLVAWATVAAGKLHFTQHQWYPRTITEMKKVLVKVREGDAVKDVEQEMPYSVTLWVPSEQRASGDLAGVQVLDQAGQPRTVKNLATLLAKPRPVFFVEEGGQLDPALAKYLSPSATILQATTTQEVDHGVHICCDMPLTPQFAQIKGDELHITKPVCEYVQKEESYQVIGANGAPETRTKTVTLTVCKFVPTVEKLGGQEALLASGEKLNEAKLRALLAKPTQVLYSSSQYISPGLLGMLNPDAIVLHPSTPANAPPGPGEAAPALPAPAPAPIAPPQPAPAPQPAPPATPS